VGPQASMPCVRANMPASPSYLYRLAPKYEIWPGVTSLGPPLPRPGCQDLLFSLLLRLLAACARSSSACPG
jgi:hypothetical protein